MEQDQKKTSYSFIVNKAHKTWDSEFIKGAEIKEVAGSPPDWVVNQIVPGPAADPEIGDDQPVNLSKDAEPKGEKKFVTRKPTTSPGAL